MSKLAKFKEFALTKEEQSKIMGGSDWVCSFQNDDGSIYEEYVSGPNRRVIRICRQRGCVGCYEITA
jgi:hypothetical protein